MSGLDNTSYTFRATASATVTLGNTDSVVSTTLAGAKAVTVPSGLLVQPGRTFTVINNGASGSATLTPAAGTINGGATYVMIAGSMATIINDGTNWIVLSYSIGPLL